MASDTPDAQASEMPVSSLNDALPLLRRPFTPEAIRFKINTVFKENKGCIIVAYIDARLVIERLNLVVGDAWTAEYFPVEGSKLLWCRLTVFDTQRRDVGESPKGMSKDLISDALKRAAVHFGIGVSVYALPQITLFTSSAGDKLEVRGGTKPTLVLTEAGHTALRGGYRTWLDEKNTFGAALDHGDVEGQTIDPDEEAEGFVPAAPAPLEDEKATALVARCEAAYDAVGDKGLAGSIPPAKFGEWLAAARHSHAELERLAVYLESIT